MDTILRTSKTVQVLNSRVEQAADPVPILSIQQEKNISTCLQFIVALGILPNLLPNIGIPVRKRSKSYDLFAGGNSITDEQVKPDDSFCIGNQYEHSFVVILEIFSSDSCS